jgi:hypothetical protein
MSKLLKAMPFGPAGRKRQNGVKPVEGLDSAFLIHAENRRVQRRLKIQANDICRLLFKLRIIADHITTQPMRLQTEMTPDSADAGLAQAQFFGQSIAAPMSRSVARTLAGELQNPRLGLRGPSSAWTSAITRIESGQTILLKAPFPSGELGGLSGEFYRFANSIRNELSAVSNLRKAGFQHSQTTH